MKLFRGLIAISPAVVWAQSGDADPGADSKDAVASKSAEYEYDETPMYDDVGNRMLTPGRQRALPSPGDDYYYVYEETGVGRKRKKKKKKVPVGNSWNKAQFAKPAPVVVTEAPTEPPTTVQTTASPTQYDYSYYNDNSWSDNSYADTAASTAESSDDGSDRGFFSSSNGSWNSSTGSLYGNYYNNFNNYGQNFNGYGNFQDSTDGFGSIVVGSTYNDGRSVADEGATNSAAWAPGVNGDGPADPVLGIKGKSTAANYEAWSNDHMNKYWEFMHRQWGQQQAERRRDDKGYIYEYSGGALTPKADHLPARFWHVGPEEVINNLSRGYLKYQFPDIDTGGNATPAEHARFPMDQVAYKEAGKHGYAWGDVPDREWVIGRIANEGLLWKVPWNQAPWMWDSRTTDELKTLRHPLDQVETATLLSEANHATNYPQLLSNRFGFTDWIDVGGATMSDGIFNAGETNMADNQASLRVDNVSPASAPWYGRFFDSSWELGQSPGAFLDEHDEHLAQVYQGFTPYDASVHADGITSGTPNYALQGQQWGSVNTIDRSIMATQFDDNENVADSPWNEYYAAHRWFDGIERVEDTAATPVVPAGTADAKNERTAAQDGEMHDPAKLKCHFCEQHANLEWDNVYHTFKLSAKQPIAAETVAADDLGDGATTINVDLWAYCFDRLNQQSCEYSSGVCFVEERRVWGYVTQVRAGCKQAQACYMQKYQNFVVEAGRQCWPADSSYEDHLLARRPDDMRADQWVYNILKGGLMVTGKAADVAADAADPITQTARYPSHFYSERDSSDTALTDAANLRIRNQPIDSFNIEYQGPIYTVTDLDDTSRSPYVPMMESKAPLTDGNYGVGRPGYDDSLFLWEQEPANVQPPQGQPILSTYSIDAADREPTIGVTQAELSGRGFYGNQDASTTSSKLLSRWTPIAYKNGLVGTSKCYQCCNTDHNCNYNWQPTTKLDWNYAFVWKYQTITHQRDNDFALPRDNAGTPLAVYTIDDMLHHEDRSAGGSTDTSMPGSANYQPQQFSDLRGSAHSNIVDATGTATGTFGR